MTFMMIVMLGGVMISFGVTMTSALVLLRERKNFAVMFEWKCLDSDTHQTSSPAFRPEVVVSGFGRFVCILQITRNVPSSHHSLIAATVEHAIVDIAMERINGEGQSFKDAWHWFAGHIRLLDRSISTATVEGETTIRFPEELEAGNLCTVWRVEWVETVSILCIEQSNCVILWARQQ